MPLQFSRRITLVVASGLVIATVLVLWAAPSPKQPRGTLVAVNGHLMHLVCTGAGEPPVILEGPQTGISAFWIPVQNGIEAFTEVCSDLGAKPLVVLTAARDLGAKWRPIWVNGLQAELTRLSTNGRQIVLENTGHGIFLDAPNEVVEGVRTVWKGARAALRR